MAFTEINEDSFHVMCKRMPKKHVHGIAEQKAYLKSGEEEDRSRHVFDDQHQQPTTNLPNEQDVFGDSECVKFVTIGEKRSCQDCRRNLVQAKIDWTTMAKEDIPNYVNPNPCTRNNSEFILSDNELLMSETSFEDGYSSQNTDTNENDENITDTNDGSPPPKRRKKQPTSKSKSKKFRYPCFEPNCTKTYKNTQDLYKHYKMDHRETWSADYKAIQHRCHMYKLENASKKSGINLAAKIKNKAAEAHNKKFACPIDNCPSSYSRKCRLFEHLALKHLDHWQDSKFQEKIKNSYSHLNEEGRVKDPMYDTRNSNYQQWISRSLHMRLRNLDKEILFCPDLSENNNGEIGKWHCLVCSKDIPYDIRKNKKTISRELSYVWDHVRAHRGWRRGGPNRGQSSLSFEAFSAVQSQNLLNRKDET